MKASLIITIFLFVSQAAAADSTWSVGLGAQYGSFIGGQYAFTKEKSRFKFALGVYGVAAGYEYALSENFSAGFGVSGSYMFRAGFAQFNYYFSGRTMPGWMLGLDVGRADLEPNCFYCDRNKEFDGENLAFLSLGYQF